MHQASMPVADAGALAIATTPATPEAVGPVLAQAWGLTGTLTRMPGERDTNFRLDAASGRYLVKVTHPAEPSLAIDAQLSALEHLRARDATLPVPAPIRTVDGGALRSYPPDPRRQLRVLRYLDGALRRDTPWQDPLAAAIGASAARLDRALSTFAHAGAAQHLLWDLRRAGELQPLLAPLQHDPIAPLLAHALEQHAHGLHTLLQLPTQAIHNDLNPSNLLVDAEGCHLIGILDFGDMIVAPLVLELAVACAYLTDAPDLAEAIGQCVAAYQRIQPLPAAALALLPDLIATRFAMTVLITEWRSRLQPENRAYILRNNPAARNGLQALDRVGRHRLVERLESGLR
jgi:hypothetical protein